MQTPVNNQKAFSLIELMVAMAMAGIVAAAMFAFQQSQVKTYVTQETVVEMHQNARAAMHFMVNEIRMAGCDPTGNADTGITSADDNSITFTMDFAGDGSYQIDFDGDGTADYQFSGADENAGNTGENITYSIDNNGNIVRTDNNAGGQQVVARNFDALQFNYYDEDGNAISTSVAPNRLDDIHSVLISLVARSGESVPGFMYPYTNNQTYTTQESEVLVSSPGDSFRRVMLETRVRVRNAG
ncbi:MAG: prepilin-type N-terminal cleavage/methylation domain-containing protein [Desulfobacteraceae bacterium]|nr:prepilin-type N-terminal cleavage/methylation domain-containing protein [Desulfobacteraceae bacterium]